MVNSPVQLTRSGVIVSASQHDLHAFAKEFHQEKAVVLPGLIAPDVLETLHARLKCANFEEKIHPAIDNNKELCLADNGTVGLLHFLVNADVFFETIRTITGCARIRSFLGRVYRVAPGLEHRDAWHDDVTANRLAAMSVNLSSEPFSGGCLQIRDRFSRQLIREVANAGSGDGLVFALSSTLEHRITEIAPGNPKTAFAGWFHSGPTFFSLVRGRLRNQ